MDDDALLASAFRKVLTADQMYLGLDSPEDESRDGTFSLLVDGRAWDLTADERGAVERALVAGGRTRLGAELEG